MCLCVCVHVCVCVCVRVRVCVCVCVHEGREGESGESTAVSDWAIRSCLTVDCKCLAAS